jgi:hypothetical protein
MGFAYWSALVLDSQMLVRVRGAVDAWWNCFRVCEFAPRV